MKHLCSTALFAMTDVTSVVGTTQLLGVVPSAQTNGFREEVASEGLSDQVDNLF